MFGVSGVCVAGVAVLAAFVCIPFGGPIAAMTQTPELSRWLWLIPISVFPGGRLPELQFVVNPAEAVSSGLDFPRRSSVAMMGSQAGAGLGGAGLMGLIGGSIFGEGCRVRGPGRASAQGRLFLVPPFDLRRRNETVGQGIRRFPPVQQHARDAERGVPKHPPLVVGALFRFGDGGIVLARRADSAIADESRGPLVAAGSFSKASEVYNSGGDVYRLFKKTTLGLLALVIVPTAIVMLFAPPAFSFVLGSDWYTAGEYARWLILWLALMFSNVPAMLTAQIHRKQKALFIVDVALLASRTGALVVGGLYCSPLHTVVLDTAVGAAFNVYIILWMWQFSRRHAATAVTAAP